MGRCARVGASAAQGGYAWRWFEDAGVRLAFGSDAPVSVISPFYGLACAVSRRRRGRQAGRRLASGATFDAGASPPRVSPPARLTRNSRARIGMLRVGMRADLTIVDRDLFKASAREIRETKVEATVVNGEILGGAAAPSR